MVKCRSTVVRVDPQSVWDGSVLCQHDYGVSTRHARITTGGTHPIDGFRDDRPTEIVASIDCSKRVDGCQRQIRYDEEVCEVPMHVRFSLIGAALTLSMWSGDTMAAQTTVQPAPEHQATVPTTVALVETWPDGRTNYELTNARRAVMWTPFFPRVKGYAPPDGVQPVYAVQLARILAGADIKVDVSVLLGSAEPPGVPVASVVVSSGSHVVVNELTKFGVQPVTLSMAAVAPMTPYLPTVVSASPRLEIAKIEVLDAPYPGYRITLRNLGSKGVSNVSVQSYRGMDKALSGLKRTDDGRPLMAPGESYTFDLNLTAGRPNGIVPSGTWTPTPIDVIEFPSVRWDDGTYEGVPPFPQVDARIESESGRRLQLRRVIEALRAAVTDSGTGAELLVAARTRIDALPDAEPDQLEAAKMAMHTTKAVVSADLARFTRQRLESGHSQIDEREWLIAMLKRYEGWLTRLSPP